MPADTKPEIMIRDINGDNIELVHDFILKRARKAFLSNMAVARQHRRRGIGSTLMRELIEFYKQRSDIETIELKVGLTNSVAIKFYLDQNFKVVEIRDTGYTMQYALEESAICCTVRPAAEAYARRKFVTL